GQTNTLDTSGATHHFGACAESQDQEDRCSLNVAPGHDAEDPRVAAGTLTPGGTTVPWVTWTEDNGSGIHQIFVARLNGDHFELMTTASRSRTSSTTRCARTSRSPATPRSS